MKRSASDDNEKKEIGARIKRLRKEAGLRQWQLAEMIGATQPAIHMYERGVLPEPKRLLEIARIGNTTVEWILTGKHWENGSVDMERVPREIYELAFRFRDYSEEDREALFSALEVINQAVAAIQKAEKENLETLSAEEIARRMKEFSRETRRALSTALEIHCSVHKALTEQGVSRMRESSLHPRDEEGAGEAAGRGRQAQYMRTSSLEPVRGHIYRLDSSMLVLYDILRDKKLRKEFEETLNKLASRIGGQGRQRTKQVKRKTAAR
ncbi:MAG TPA: helix-turn-helix transcriptional regulator [Candidatus Saccharimonadales bacterium]|nr:helix-turn-helix transcriptional regulator [Candidatus Saccharimonadales bacterium]